MYKITILFGVLLIATGLTGYVGTGSEQKTALIPAGFGVILLICGLLAANESRRMMAMHIAVLIGLLGALGSTISLFTPLFREDQSETGLIEKLVTFIPDLFRQAGNGEAAVISKLVTLILCVVFVGLCIRSFIQARKAREAAEAEKLGEGQEISPEE